MPMNCVIHMKMSDPHDMAGSDSNIKPIQDSETNDYTPQKEFKATSYLEDIKYLLTK